MKNEFFVLPTEIRQISAKFAPQSSTLCLLGRPLFALNRVFQFFIKSHQKNAVHAKTPERKLQKCNNFLEKSNFLQTFHEVPLNRSHQSLANWQKSDVSALKYGFEFNQFCNFLKDDKFSDWKFIRDFLTKISTFWI